MYCIYADDICIYNDVYALDNMKLVNPKLILEDNCAGSLTMTLPPSNVGYDTIQRLITEISVKKNGLQIWTGRVLSESKDFWNNRVLTCEGELAFLNDSTQPPAEYREASVRGFLESLLRMHNSKVDAKKRFVIGAVTVHDLTDQTVYYTNYEKTIELINSLVEQLGGHLRIRYENDIRYLDYLAEYPRTSSQIIQMGKNLIDFTRNWDESEYATAIVPLGGRLKKNPIEALDAYLTVESVNGGSMYIQSDDAVEAYGWIEKTVKWDDVNDAETLLTKGQIYLADLQFDSMTIELSALDLHYMDVNSDDVRLLDEIRVISHPHGMDRHFPVTRLEIPLDHPENTQFKLGDTLKTSLTGVNNQINAAILKKIDEIPKASSILKEAKENATAIMNLATTGYITITQDDMGSDTMYISNDRDYTKATRLWKWNMNGLGYSNDGGKTFGLAITMDGAIVADYITSGILNADVIRAGVLRDLNSNFVLDLTTGKLIIKKGSIHLGEYMPGQYNFEVDENGRLYARTGIFAGDLAAAGGTFGGKLVAVTGDFKGVVQASDFLDRNGNSMMDLTKKKFTAEYLDLYGLTIYNKSTNGVTFQVDSNGGITVNGKITMGYGSSINWANVSNTNIRYSPAYDLADEAYDKAVDAYNLADDAYDEATAAYRRANAAYTEATSISLPSYIKSTYIDSATIRSPVIEGGYFYGSEFNVITGDDEGGFYLYGKAASNRYKMFAIEYDWTGFSPQVTLYSPVGAEMQFGTFKNSIYIPGKVQFTGTVDFTNATVKGL